MNLPPEVYGCLSLAQRHLNTSRKGKFALYRNRDPKMKHVHKVQKLVAKAVRILNKRGIEVNDGNSL